MKKHILVVDDDEGILDAIRFALEYEGYEVVTDNKGDHISALLSQTKDFPSMIILDVLLSGNDGRTLCKQLKDNASTKNIPILMTSAHPNIHTSTAKAGADEFLAKPFDIDELLSKIATLIQ